MRVMLDAKPWLRKTACFNFSVRKPLWFRDIIIIKCYKYSVSIFCISGREGKIDSASVVTSCFLFLFSISFCGTCGTPSPVCKPPTTPTPTCRSHPRCQPSCNKPRLGRYREFFFPSSSIRTPCVSAQMRVKCSGLPWKRNRPSGKILKQFVLIWFYG